MAGDRIALALLLATSSVGALSAGACAQSLATAEKGRAVADSTNPIARLDSRQIESVLLRRYSAVGRNREAWDGDTVTITTSGPGAGLRSTDCSLTSADAAALIAILASAAPRDSTSESLPLDLQVRIRARNSLEIVATLPPIEASQPDGSFSVAIAAGADGRFYRLGGDDLAAINQIAEAAGCS